MSGKNPTAEQQEARDRETQAALYEMAKQGNAKAKEAITKQGGKK